MAGRLTWLWTGWFVGRLINWLVARGLDARDAGWDGMGWDDWVYISELKGGKVWKVAGERGSMHYGMRLWHMVFATSLRSCVAFSSAFGGIEIWANKSRRACIVLLL